jgi:hypothetical protein
LFALRGLGTTEPQQRAVVNAFDQCPVAPSADVIDALCGGTKSSEHLCALRQQILEVEAMIEGMLAEFWRWRGYQEDRLHNYQELLQVCQGGATLEQRRAR